MSNRDEDVLPVAYKYAWSSKSELPLEDFLRKVLVKTTVECSGHTHMSDNLTTSPVQTIHGPK